MSDTTLVVPNNTANSNSQNNNQTSISNNWRSTTTSSVMASSSSVGVAIDNSNSTSSIQKRGAERLFSYMEADGSDTEDYTR